MRASKEIEKYFLGILQTGLDKRGLPGHSLEIRVLSTYDDEKDAFDTCYEYHIVVKLKKAEYLVKKFKEILTDKELPGVKVIDLDNGSILLEMNVDIRTWYSLNQLRELSYE